MRSLLRLLDSARVQVGVQMLLLCHIGPTASHRRAKASRIAYNPRFRLPTLRNGVKSQSKCLFSTASPVRRAI